MLGDALFPCMFTNPLQRLVFHWCGKRIFWIKWSFICSSHLLLCPQTGVTQGINKKTYFIFQPCPTDSFPRLSPYLISYCLLSVAGCWSHVGRRQPKELQSFPCFKSKEKTTGKQRSGNKATFKPELILCSLQEIFGRCCDNTVGTGIWNFRAKKDHLHWFPSVFPPPPHSVG